MGLNHAAFDRDDLDMDARSLDDGASPLVSHHLKGTAVKSTLIVSSLAVLVASLAACSSTGDESPGSLVPSASDAGDEGDAGDAGDDVGSGGGGDGAAWSLDADPDVVPLDPEKDNDGDGYLFKDDCDDTNPEVNPGAYDVPGDGVDNDCNGKVDDDGDCDTIVDADHYKSTDALHFARALGLCRTATPGAEGKDKTWGVLSAELVRADGSPISDDSRVQHGILPKFGTLLPREGKNMVVLSSGTARTPAYPDFRDPYEASFRSKSEVKPPPGHPINTVGCPPPFDRDANDSVNLALRIRVPTNASSFSFDFDFFSSEYIGFVCTEYNDSFVALLDSAIKFDPKHAGNVAFDSLGNPVNVNSGFFEACKPGGTKYPCPKGTDELVDTGFWVPSNPYTGGATSWLETKAPVQPGEEITIRFMIWDTSDHILDSTVLLDNWRWDAKPTTAPVTDRPK